MSPTLTPRIAQAAQAAADRALADALDRSTLMRMRAGLQDPSKTHRARELMQWRIESTLQRMAERAQAAALAERESPCERYARESELARLGLFLSPRIEGLEVTEISQRSWFAELAAR